MRALRFLLPIAAALVAFFVYRDFDAARRSRGGIRLVEPDAIGADLASRSGRWRWEQSDAEASRVTVSAGGFRQGKDNSTIELSDVVLRVYHDGDASFDRIETDAAIFDLHESRLVSRAEVSITLGVPADTPDSRDPSLTRIVAPQASFDTKAGTADADGETHYEFAGGRGSSVGAFYDSAGRYFHMKSQARVERFASGPGGVATIVTAGRLYYQERDGRVDLRDGATLARGSQFIRAGEAEVQLIDGKVKSIHARHADGRENSNGREVRFRSPKLTAIYDDGQRLERVEGEGGSELTSRSASSVLRVQGERIDLRYEPGAVDSGDSLLREAFVRERARLDVEPVGPGGETRRVESAAIRLGMRDDGRSADIVETLERGFVTIEPRGPAGVARRVEGDRVRVEYADDNRMKALTALGSVAAERGSSSPGAPPLRTWSGRLEAAFDPATGEFAELRQWESFRFEEGARRGSAAEASFSASGDQVVLEGGAQVLDPGGRITAHRIALDQRSQRMTAAGDVTAVYRESSGDSAGGLFAEGEPVFATALEMESDQAQNVLVYRGEARLWQGANRVEAPAIRVDRAKRELRAWDGAVSILEEAPAEKGGAPRLLEVRADRLHYADATRVALYEGDVDLRREGLRVTAARLEAQLSPADAKEAARLERAEASGSVRIAESAVPGAAARLGLGDEAFYDPVAETVLLRGAPARALNANGEETRGAALNYSLGDDKLQVSGGDGRAFTFRRRDR